MLNYIFITSFPVVQNTSAITRENEYFCLYNNNTACFCFSSPLNKLTHKTMNYKTVLAKEPTGPVHTTSVIVSRQDIL